jgi:hypothetical protein
MLRYCPFAGSIGATQPSIAAAFGYCNKPPSTVDTAAFNRAFTLWCATSARPFAMRDDPGFRLTVSAVKPHGAEYVKAGLSRTSLNKVLEEQAALLERKIREELERCRKFSAPEGGPFCFVQLDMTTDQASHLAHLCLSEFFLCMLPFHTHRF